MHQSSFFAITFDNTLVTCFLTIQSCFTKKNFKKSKKLILEINFLNKEKEFFVSQA